MPIWPFKLNWLLWDTGWGVFCAQTAITHSAPLLQTIATKDGAQMERHLVCTLPEEIGYLVGTSSSVMGDQLFEPKSEQLSSRE